MSWVQSFASSIGISVLLAGLQQSSVASKLSTLLQIPPGPHESFVQALPSLQSAAVTQSTLITPAVSVSGEINWEF
jgi:hypothetical protein